MENFLREYAGRVKDCLGQLPWKDLGRVVDLLTEKVRGGKQVFVFGNGACSAASSHFVCDLSKGCVQEGSPRVKAISLNDCVPLMTAWSNDVGYEVVFKEQLANLMNPGDLVLGLSASGNSPNVLRAIEYANSHGGVTAGLVGKGGGGLAGLAKVPVLIKGDSYEEVEDVIMIITHMLKMALIERLQPSPATS